MSSVPRNQIPSFGRVPYILQPDGTYAPLEAATPLSVTSLFARQATVSDKITPLPSYAQYQAIGRLLTFDCGAKGLSPGAAIRINRVGMDLIIGTITAFNSPLTLRLFGTAPAAAISDGAIPAWTKADSALRPLAATLAPINGAQAAIGMLPLSAGPGGTLILDAAAKFYGVIISAVGAQTWVAPDESTIWCDVQYN